MNPRPSDVSDNLQLGCCAHRLAPEAERPPQRVPMSPTRATTPPRRRVGTSTVRWAISVIDKVALFAAGVDVGAPPRGPIAMVDVDTAMRATPSTAYEGHGGSGKEEEPRVVSWSLSSRWAHAVKVADAPTRPWLVIVYGLVWHCSCDTCCTATRPSRIHWVLPSLCSSLTASSYFRPGLWNCTQVGTGSERASLCLLVAGPNFRPLEPRL